MKLENQVTSLELSKLLKKLGVKQESLWTWVKDSITHNYKLVITGNKGWTDYICAGRDFKGGEMFSSFTVAELGEMLPEKVLYKNSEYLLNTYLYEKLWNILYQADEMGDLVGDYDTVEANARAKMLVYLLENELIP